MLIIIPLIGIFLSCSSTKRNQEMGTQTDKIKTTEKGKTSTKEFLDSLLASYPQYFAEILKNQDDLNIQVIYTKINRAVNGNPVLEHHYFNTDKEKYFYPASTVKLPVVLLSLQKLNELRTKGISRNTTMLIEAAFSGQSAVFNDPTTIDGKPSIENYIKKILLVSDNDAYNRLYEFLGQEYINVELQKKGYKDVEILHRLDIFLTEEENRRTNPVNFYTDSAAILYRQPAQNNTVKYSVRKEVLGKGYYTNGKLVNRPMDFSKKNKIGLEDLHKMLISLVFPEKVPAGERFNITEDDRRFILKYMGKLPVESLYPPYAVDNINYWPAKCKFLLFGAEKGKLPDNIRIFNKVGDAYGHLIDVAYVTDQKNKIEFFVSAVIYCNSNGLLNDDKYDYALTGLPFMKNLGKVIYDYELKREYKIKPDLSPLLFAFDK